MTLEEAIRTALRYEDGIHALYGAAAKTAADEAGRDVYAKLAEEEQGHIDYLQSRLAEWTATGRVTPGTLATAIPSRVRIAAGLRRVRERAAAEKPEPHHAADVETLRKALQMEVETSGFYRKMVRELPAGERSLFERFVEIEEGHVAIVQAEIDALTETGFWFETREFDLEAG